MRGEVSAEAGDKWGELAHDVNVFRQRIQHRDGDNISIKTNNVCERTDVLKTKTTVKVNEDDAALKKHHLCDVCVHRLRDKKQC